MIVTDDGWDEVKRVWDQVKVVPSFPLPDGWYTGEIVSVELLKNGNGNPYFRIGFASWDEKFKGGRAFRDTWINSPKNIEKAKEKLGTFGVTDFEAVRKGGLLGKAVHFGVQTKLDGRGPEISNVNYFVPRNPSAEPPLSSTEDRNIPF